jgi:hypothetical protein
MKRSGCVCGTQPFFRADSPDFESFVNRWQTAGVLDAEAARRIRAYEE